MANLNDLDDVTISSPKVGDVVKYTAQGWQNGADSTGGNTPGNPCGTLDGYTKNDRKETITEPWTWDLPKDVDGFRDQDAITVKNDADEIAYYSAHRARLDNNLGYMKMQIETNGEGMLQAQNQMIFYDSLVPQGVTLNQLYSAVGNNNNNQNTENTIISGQFKFSSPLTQSFSQWRDEPGIISPTDKRYLNWRTSDPLSITLPNWATGAVVIYSQFTQMTMSDNILNHPYYNTGINYPFRQYTAHTVTVKNAEFRVGAATGNDSMLNIVEQNFTVDPNIGTIEAGNRSFFNETTNYQFLKLTGSSRTIEFTQTIDILRGGWNKIDSGTGRMIVFPIIYNSTNIIAPTGADVLSNSPNATTVNYDTRMEDIIDIYYPPYSYDDLVLDDSKALKSAIVNALNVANDHLSVNPSDSTVENIRDEIYALKTETSIDFAESKFKVLAQQLGAAVAWKFDWEPAGYSLV